MDCERVAAAGLVDMIPRHHDTLRDRNTGLLSGVVSAAFPDLLVTGR